MAGKVFFSVSMSLDGYIAPPPAIRLRNPPVRGRGRGPRGPGAGPRGADAAGDPPDLRRAPTVAAPPLHPATRAPRVATGLLKARPPLLTRHPTTGSGQAAGLSLSGSLCQAGCSS
jgi:hypothetical protein